MTISVAQSVAKNTTVMAVSQCVTWGSSFVLMLFLPRYLGSVEYGKLFLAISVTTIFQMLIEFGGGYYIAKEVSREREKIAFILSNAVALRFTLWLGAFAAMLWGAAVAGYTPPVIALMYILGFSKLWEGIGKVFHSTCQGLEMMHYPALGAIAERMAVTALSVMALLLGAGVIEISLIMAAGALLNYIILSRLMNRIVPYLWIPRREEIFRIARASVPYFLWMMFSVAYYRIDAVMLSLMVPGEVVGWYGASYRFFDVLMFLPSIYSIALFPSLSRMWAVQQNAAGVTTQKSLRFIILAGIPISIGVFAFSGEIIELFFGTAEYAPSVLLLKIFAAGLLLVYIDFVLGTALFASDRQRQWTWIAFFALLLNPFLNYFLIPFTQAYQGNGGVGAAIATLLTEYFVMVMALMYLPQSVKGNADMRYLYKGCCAGAMMIAVLWLMHDGNVPWIVSAAVASVVYVMGLLNLKAIDTDELAFFHSFFSFRNLKSLFVVSKDPRS